MSEKYEYDHQYMQHLYFFGPYLHHNKIDPKFVKELLIEGKKCTHDMRHHLAGDLRGEYKFTAKQQMWFDRHMREVFNHYCQKRAHWHNNKIVPDYLIDNVWINYQYALDWQPEHVHSGDFSWVIYLQIPPSIAEEAKNTIRNSAPPGSIVFSYGEMTSYTELDHVDTNWAVSGQSFIPVEGEMFTFPAQMRHAVPPFKGAGCRISLSGNASFQRRDGLRMTWGDVVVDDI